MNGPAGMSAGRRGVVAATHAAPVLDIGGDVGAVVAYLPERPASGELEACPVGEPAARFHTGVHRWSVAGREAWAAVFPEVAAGAYHLLDAALTPVATLRVRGGEVGYVDLRPA